MKKQILITSALCLGLMASAETIDVQSFRYAGPYAVQTPFMIDNVDVNSKAFSLKAMLDTPLSLDILEQTPVSNQLPTLSGNALHVLAFHVQNTAYTKAKLKVEGLTNYQVYVDGKKFNLEGNKDKVTQITMGSKGQKWMDFSNFNGKVRTLGSSIIHLICPVVFPSFQGCVNQPCFVWDVTSAHAILKYFGMDIVYADGSAFEYDDAFVIEKKPFKMTIYAGTEKAREELIRTLPLKD